MGFLKRSRDPDVLYQYGITSISTNDFRGAIAIGWTLWELVGLTSHQADDFLYDGYIAWRGSSEFDRVLALSFLTEYFEQLEVTAPPVPPDIYAVPPDVVSPIATAYGTTCFAGTELLEQAEGAGRADIISEFAPRVYAAVTRAHRDFVSGRAMAWVREYAASHNLPAPW